MQAAALVALLRALDDQLGADGQITQTEQAEFSEIYKQLDQLANSVESLKIWVRKTLTDGKLQNPFD